MKTTNSGIIRTFRKRNNFVIIDKTALEDSRLSFKARGMLAYLLSKPDDWTTNVQDLINESPEGKTAIQSGLKELETLGYLIRNRRQDSSGQFYYETIVFETTQDREDWKNNSTSVSTVTRFSVHGKTVDGKPVDGKPGHIINNEKPINEELNKINICVSRAREFDDLEPEPEEEVVQDCDNTEDFNETVIKTKYFLEGNVPAPTGIDFKKEFPWAWESNKSVRYDAIFAGFITWYYPEDGYFKKGGSQANVELVRKFLNEAFVNPHRRQELIRYWQDFEIC